jgi:hypothetical protein
MLIQVLVLLKCILQYHQSIVPRQQAWISRFEIGRHCWTLLDIVVKHRPLLLFKGGATSTLRPVKLEPDAIGWVGAWRSTKSNSNIWACRCLSRSTEKQSVQCNSCHGRFDVW